MGVQQLSLGLSAGVGPKATRLAAYLDSLVDAPGWRERVLRALFLRGPFGATSDELEVMLGCQFTTAGAVIIKLRAEGWVVDSGKTRTTRRGHQAVVWVALEERASAPTITMRGKGKYKAACEEAYMLLRCAAWEEAEAVLGAALGKGAADGVGARAADDWSA
jgi:hypothetical protein